MIVVIDIEADALVNPQHIWLAVCKDINTGERYIFREGDRDAFIEFSQKVDRWISHNGLGYDFVVLRALWGYDCLNPDRHYDTLILSKLIDYSRSGHSIENYGEEFGIPKGKFVDFSKYSQEMEDYCVRDVDICHRIFSKYAKYIANPSHHPSILLEHQFQLVVNSLHDNGFSFNSKKAQSLLSKVESELATLDKDILEAFPPKLKLIREITPKETKHGTLSRTDFRWLDSTDLSEYNGGPFCRCAWMEFNPSSHKQIVQILTEAKWSPVDRTQTHIDTERTYNQLKYRKGVDNEKTLLYDKLQSLKKTGYKVNETNLDTLPAKAPVAARLLAKRILYEARRRTLTEWLDLVWFEIEIEHVNSGTLGINTSGKLIQNGKNVSAKRTADGGLTILESPEQVIAKDTLNTHTDCHSKTLLEWLKSNKVDVQFVKEKPNLTSITVIGQAQLENFFAVVATVTSDGSKQTLLRYKIISERIHGRFNGIGAWSHRMNHQNPNTANIPNESDTAGKKKLLGKELRSLWCAPKNRLLVGVDAEGIQLRIFAHLIDDPEFTRALVEGKKDDKTDPHSLNQRIIGDVCKSRAAAKRFIYALLLGAGMPKLAEILGCSEPEARDGLGRLLGRYTGWASLKEEVFPRDAERGYFIGLDGRKVRIPGDTGSSRRHLAMSGYLQNGEAVVMKKATVKWLNQLQHAERWEERIYPELRKCFLVNFVHDEWQTETPNNMEIALTVAKLQADSLKEVGEELNLKCPLAGSYYNDDLKDYTIATNWAYTH